MRPIAGFLAAILLALTTSAGPANSADCLDDVDQALAAAPAQPTGAHARPPNARPIISCLSQQLKQLKKQISTLKEALYDDTDEVYTISHQFSSDDLKDASHPLIYVHYIYADPTRHHISLSLVRRDNNFTFTLVVNGYSLGTQVNNLIDFDLTPVLKQHALMATRAGVDVALSGYPKFVQEIELTPTHPNWDAGPIASIDGYVLVQRASPDQPQ